MLQINFKDINIIFLDYTVLIVINVMEVTSYNSPQ